MKPQREFDVIVLGGGIAGMTAAIYTARANLATVIIEKMVCGGLVNSTYVVENFPSYASVHGMDLMEKVQEQVQNLGVEVEQMAEIVSLDIKGDTKQVETDEGIYTGRAVILATGREPIKLDVGGDCEDVHYCSVCDGSHYERKKVLVIGGGNSGFDEAAYLLSLGVQKLTLVEVADRFFASEVCQEKLLGDDRVDARISTFVKELITNHDGRLSAVMLQNSVTGSSDKLDVDGIFVFIGQQPNTDMFKGVIDLDDDGYVIANGKMETNILGVYAAGDVVQKEFRQITTAMADGTIAALRVAKYLGSRS